MKKISKILLLALVVLGLTGCDSDATVVTENIKTESEQFKVRRRIVFLNMITGDYIFQAEGNCSIETNTIYNRLELTCKSGPDEYKVHYFGLSNNASYTVEQLDWVEANKYKYKIVFKPESIIPFEMDVE